MDGLIPGAARRVLRRGDLAFTAWEMGQGPLVLFVHGFPDTPATWRPLLPRVAARGFRAVAVTCRGYEPSSRPADADFGLMELVDDVLGWLDALDAPSAHLVGHDWGSSLVQLAAAKAPQRVVSLTLLAVAHPAAFAALLPADFAQLERTWYIQFLQAPGAAEAVAADGRFLEWLWRRWSPGWEPDPGPLAAMRAAFAEPGVLDSALAYYRRAFADDHPRFAEALALLGRAIPCPALGLAGALDTCVLPTAFERALPPEIFTAGRTVQVVPDAGHFLHLEQPTRVADAVTAWLAGRR